MDKSRVMYPRMNNHLGGMPKEILLKMANEISAKKGIPSPDRICRRNRDPLICWFCESCPELFSPQLTLISFGHPEPEPAQRLPFPPISDLIRGFPIFLKVASE
jgi:hypothetical protein